MIVEDLQLAFSVSNRIRGGLRNLFEQGPGKSNAAYQSGCFRDKALIFFGVNVVIRYL